ncbi:MAG: RibD family protein [Spirulinaceae cyanobacterium]
MATAHPQDLRPKTVVVLAMSADGKISDRTRQPARFGSRADRHHLEHQIAQADGVLIGANTLRAYQTSVTLQDPRLLAQRAAAGRSPQPWHWICSRSGQLDPNWRFFRQPLRRGLITTPGGAITAQDCAFERVLTPPHSSGDAASAIAWPQIWSQFHTLGIRQLAILGGGNLIASLAAIAALDELWLTLCPYLIGGENAPTPYDGLGHLLTQAPQLELLSHRVVGQEVFLHYRFQTTVHPPTHPPANPAAAALPAAAAPDPPPEQSPPQTESTP